MIVGADFPDEQYADFDAWAAAMASDDTEAPTSPLWHGGGQWLLYGLGLVLGCKILITSLCKTTDRTLVLPLCSALLLDRRRPNPKPYPYPYQVSRPSGGHRLRGGNDPGGCARGWCGQQGGAAGDAARRRRLPRPLRRPDRALAARLAVHLAAAAEGRGVDAQPQLPAGHRGLKAFSLVAALVGTAASLGGGASRVSGRATFCVLTVVRCLPLQPPKRAVRAVRLAGMGKQGHVPKIKSKKKKKSPAKTEVKAAPLSTPDDVDEFVAGRHELKLHGNNYDDDDDDDEEDEVLALEGPDSDEEEEEDDEGEDGKFDDDEDEDEDEDAEATGAATAGWGRKKKDFYGGDSADDVSDEEAEEAARLEQEEVLRLQRDHAAGLEADDFGELDPSAEGDAADRPSDAQLLARLNEDLEAGAAGMNVEAVERDMSRLSEKEKLQLVEKQAPELLQLLGDFKGHMREVRERIAPLLAAARQKQLGQEGGVSFLELKLQLLLSYCVNISFYLLLKAQVTLTPNP